MVSLWGRSAPDLGEIGKALAGLVPTVSAVERYFSKQESHLTAIGKRLIHDNVAKLMIVHMNFNKHMDGVSIS